QADRLRFWTDEYEARLLHRLGECGILGEKAIARMNRIGAALARRLDDRRLIEIGFGRLRRPDRDRLIGKLDGERIRIGLTVDLNRPHAQFARRPQDAHRDLAAIGYEELADHPLPPLSLSPLG